MSNTARKAGPSLQAEVALSPQLKNCFTNLPPSLVAPVQNVIVELILRQSPTSSSRTTNNSSNQQRSIFLGWTGMQTKSKIASVVGRDGLAGRGGSSREHDVNVVEVDAAFGRLLGLSNGQKIRALPNPLYTVSPAHPLSLQLSPTSTANITVTSLTPAPPTSTPFVKIAPNAEVHVAPKMRSGAAQSAQKESRSVASAGRKSTGGKSGTSTVRHRSSRGNKETKEPLFFRGVDRKVASAWFEDTESSENEGLQIWLDPDVLLSKTLRGVTWVAVSVIKPAGLQEPREMHAQGQTPKELEPASKVVAKLGTWEDAPDSRHAALSSQLLDCLDASGLAGGLVRVEPAPTQIHKLLNMWAEGKEQSPRKLKIFPFASSTNYKSQGLHFGGENSAEREESTRRLGALFVGTSDGNGLLKGPVTDGMILPSILSNDGTQLWPGGLLRFDPPPPTAREGYRTPLSWFNCSEKRLGLELQPEIPKPAILSKDTASGEELPRQTSAMVGVENVTETMISHLLHFSSVLLTGSLGAGKTSMSQLLSQGLRNEFLYHIIYFSCRTLVTDETRISTIKETWTRIFARAAWGARLGGRALVILDDLDRICPTETELQVGGNNERSRQVSEILCSLVHQYCSSDSAVVLLATAQSKEAVNNVIIGGHVVREIVNLAAPNKETRRQVLEGLMHESYDDSNSSQTNDIPVAEMSPKGNAVATNRSSISSRPPSSSRREDFLVSPHIDFLDIAGQTDGYMPGDLSLLISRARSEALIRAISQSSTNAIELTSEDFTAALRGFTPASLRNVTLQTSSTSFSSIGGLKYTRQILLETLQYPTTYAPIFANCPLRLRSGLLLYGYPGCGKTLLASAVAGECGLNFISVKGPEILNKYIGASEKSVRDLFERAQAARPCVLFFDEFDSVAPKRGHDSTGVTDRVVNQLLTQMDGAEGLSGVYVLAATSRPDLIDPALLRPGRLDKSLICDLPNLEDRLDILKRLCEKLKVGDDVLSDGDEGSNLLEVAKQTEGYSGADLQAVVYNAHLEAIHDVLGVDTSGETDFSRESKTKDTKRKDATRGSSKTPDFIHFRFGDDPSLDTNNTTTPSNKDLTERAQIAEQLATLQLQRRKQKQMIRASRQGQSTRQDGHEQEDGEDEDNEKEPVITWQHLESSLRTTRSSISPEERMRLARIYREFVVGRNGEMPSGQGGNEIGGRTSLM
ncbi:MAG: Peroxisome biosynthesis protein pex1 [Bogoriella megaspora]|nr:MAG: Peroxisome biosynthesis protein pex1 [Bogoriella megaspora]